MSTSYVPGLTKNQKRGCRRSNLDARLALAHRDAALPGRARAAAPWQVRAPEPKAQPKAQPKAKSEIKSEIKDEPKSEDESLPVQTRGKPSRAAHLEMLAPVGVGAESVRGDSDEDSPVQELDAYDFMAEDVRSSSREPSASAWMEEGRLQKEEEHGGRGRGTVRLRPRRSVEPERRRGEASGSSRQDPPPWRQGGELRGIKRVLPRWEVERGLDRAQPPQPVQLNEEDRNLSKVSTQLLMWGRADVVSQGGGQRSLWLENWAPDAWFSLGDIARAMHVPREKLPLAILCTEGSHGQRVLCREEHGRVVFKARWTNDEVRRRGHRGDQHGGRRDQGGDSHRGQRDGRRRGRDGH